MTATGLSANPQQYRDRLDEQPDEQIDAWVAELMRDISIRTGVRARARRLAPGDGTDDAGLRRLYTAGGGPAAAIGSTDGRGELMVPAISLFYFVSGVRARVARRAQPADRIPRGPFRRARLHLASAVSAGRWRPAARAARRPSVSVDCSTPRSSSRSPSPPAPTRRRAALLGGGDARAAVLHRRDQRPG